MANSILRYIKKNSMGAVLRENLCAVIVGILPRFYGVDYFRSFLFKCAGIRVGSRVCIRKGFELYPYGSYKRLCIGSSTFINSGVRIGLQGQVTIGAGFMIWNMLQELAERH